MDRFLLAENPIKKPNSNEYNPLYIIHTIEPKCIIEVICLNDFPEIPDSKIADALYDHINTDGVSERWILVVKDNYSSAMRFDLERLLPRAWRWYRSYLEWEDTNIDIQ